MSVSVRVGCERKRRDRGAQGTHSCRLLVSERRRLICRAKGLLDGRAQKPRNRSHGSTETLGMHAKHRFDEVAQRLEACRAELERQDQVWAKARAVLAEAKDIRFAFESLPEATTEHSPTLTNAIRA